MEWREKEGKIHQVWEYGMEFFQGWKRYIIETG